VIALRGASISNYLFIVTNSRMLLQKNIFGSGYASFTDLVSWTRHIMIEKRYLVGAIGNILTVANQSF